jgi:hypothetical protein
MLFVEFPKHKERCRFFVISIFYLFTTTLSGIEPIPSNPPIGKSDSLPNIAKSEYAPNIESTPPQFLYSKTHRIGVDYRPEYVFRTNDFVRGYYDGGKAITNTNSLHLQYSFAFAKNTLSNLTYHGVYQGVGVVYQSFHESRYLGNPISVYLFQGAKLLTFNPRLSFNYEWDFGLSFGWKPYDRLTNINNIAIGSPVNAYMNLNFYLNYKLSPQVDLISGASVTHFSNGNTKYPNAGLNTIGVRVGLVYNISQHSGEGNPKTLFRPIVPKFPHHFSYDCVLFGFWRRKGVLVGEERIASPDAYLVSGFNFAPMYNLGYIFRAGLSLDGVYDQSANIYAKYSGRNADPYFQKPSLDKQLALGISGRTELVMPYFRVNIGMGANFVGKADQRGTYQILALKIETFKSSFIHIGYNLKDFHTPNYLMLGIGYRFHDKYPTIHRK